MEINILNFIQQNINCPIMNSIMIFFTTLGNLGMIWIVTGVTLLLIKKYRYWGAMLLVTLVITFLTNDVVIKNLVERPRPFITDPSITLLIPSPSGSSFPSGHSATSFACAYVLFKMNKKIGIPALIAAGLIAFSRLYLCVHYPTDVLAGIVLGLICAEVVYIVFSKVREKHNLKGDCVYNGKV